MVLSSCRYGFTVYFLVLESQLNWILNVLNGLWLCHGLKCLFCPVITALLRSGQSFGSVFVLSALCQRAMAAAGCGLGQRVSLPLPSYYGKREAEPCG